MLMTFQTGFLLALCLPPVLASLVPPISGSGHPSSRPATQGFKLQDKFIGNDFFSSFAWDTFDDPTHGRVNYVDKATAIKRNLTSVTAEKFIMRADDTNIVSSNARGRDSNRIRSHNTYTDSVLVLDVEHVPWGCATWPAFWTVTQTGWPNGGEIDILEGVNLYKANQATLHTSRGCEMDQDRPQSGTTISTDCVAYDNGNQGCATAFQKRGSYGPDLNSMGGGHFVMKRTQSDGVHVWFFGRNDPSVPSEVVRGGDHVNPDQSWGKPDARFPSTEKCNFAKHFDAHEIVFDLTFCGDWAGDEFSTTCGPGSCQSYVDNNPQSFEDAYWEINSLRVYVPT